MIFSPGECFDLGDAEWFTNQVNLCFLEKNKHYTGTHIQDVYQYKLTCAKFQMASQPIGALHFKKHANLTGEKLEKSKKNDQRTRKSSLKKKKKELEEKEDKIRENMLVGYKNAYSACQNLL